MISDGQTRWRSFLFSSGFRPIRWCFTTCTSASGPRPNARAAVSRTSTISVDPSMHLFFSFVPFHLKFCGLLPTAISSHSQMDGAEHFRRPRRCSKGSTCRLCSISAHSCRTSTSVLMPISCFSCRRSSSSPLASPCRASTCRATLRTWPTSTPAAGSPLLLFGQI